MKEDYLAAFATRERFAELFEPPAEGGKAFLEPVFEKNRRGGDRKISVLDSGRMVREQNKRQLKMMGKEMGMPRLSLKDPIVNSLTGPAASGRPLCNVSDAVEPFGQLWAELTRILPAHLMFRR